VTSQNVLSKSDLSGHVSNLKGHCPLTCCYFEPCIFFYDGKLFWLRAIGHRNLCIANFKIYDKLFLMKPLANHYTVVKDFKNTSNVTTHVCHEKGKEKMYKLYSEKVKMHTLTNFYFKPSCDVEI